MLALPLEALFAALKDGDRSAVVEALKLYHGLQHLQFAQFDEELRLATERLPSLARTAEHGLVVYDYPLAEDFFAPEIVEALVEVSSDALVPVARGADTMQALAAAADGLLDIVDDFADESDDLSAPSKAALHALYHLKELGERQYQEALQIVGITPERSQ